MLIGVPRETAAGETRVAVTPETAKKLKAQGTRVRVQSGAGVAASVTDEAYAAAGAEIIDRGRGLRLRARAQGALAERRRAGADEAAAPCWSACSTPSTPPACSAWPRPA